MYVDGIRDVGGATREIFAIESIEVLKGPSGAYDGRGSGGGSINLVTKLPKAENFIAGSAGLGTDMYRRGTADANYMLSDEVAIRVNAMAHTADTPGRDDVDVRRWGFAPSITLGLNTPTSATLSYYHLQTDDMPDYGIPYTNTGAANRLANGDKPADVDKDNFYGLKNRDFRETQADIGTATIKHAFSETTILRNTTRYGVTTNEYIVTVPDDSKGNVQNGFVYRAPKQRDSKTTTIANVTDFSIQAMTGNIKHTINTGIEISREETKNHPDRIVNTPGVTGDNCAAGNLTANFYCTSLADPDAGDPWSGSILSGFTKTESTATTKSAYVFDSMELSKAWILNLGLRYDNYSTESDAFRSDTNVRTQLENDSDFVNYQAGVVYKVRPDMSLYASYGTSSTPSGTTLGTGSDNISAANEDLDPERTKSYEVGAKWDVMQNLALTAAIFRTEKTNARVTQPDGTTALAGNQEVKGFELGIAGNLTDKWQAFGGYTFLDSELVDNGDVAANALNDGNRFPNTPKHSASIWTTYALTPSFTIGGGAFYVDKQFGNTANSVSIPSFVRYDAVATYEIDTNLNLQLNVQNLTDERYFNAAYTSHYAQVAPGRLGFLTLNFKY
jgi:catecholate siderophore receptor